MVVRAGSNARLRRLSRGDGVQPVTAPAASVPARGGFAPPFQAQEIQAQEIRAQEIRAQEIRAQEIFSPASFAPGDEARVGLVELGDVMRRRAGLICATTALFTCAGIAAAFVISPRYIASSALFIDPRARASFQTDNQPAVGHYDPNLVDSLTFVMESDAILRRVVASEGLAKDEEFVGAMGDPNANAVAGLREAVKVKRPDRTYVVEIQVRTKDPAKSARLANAIAAAYLSDGSDTKNDSFSRERGWVDEQLAALEKRLRDAEARVDAYKTRNGIHDTEGRLVGEQQLGEMNRALSDAQRKAAEAKSVLDQVDGLRRAGRLPDITSEALRSGVIERLRAQHGEILRLEANSRMTLGPRHPASIEVREQLVETQRQINAELARIAENARSAHALARSNVQGFERELERLKKNQSTDNHTLLGLRELQRAVEAQKAVYEKFLRDKEAISRMGIETPAGRIIQPAEVPKKASFPNKPLFIGLGFVAGLLLGSGLALLLETLSLGRGARRGAGGFALGAGGTGLTFARRSPPIATLPAPVPRARFGLGARMDPLSAVLAAPEGDYARAVEGLAGRLGPEDLPETLLLSGFAARSSNPALVLALALALTRLGRSVAMVDGHGGAGSLSEKLAGQSMTAEAILGGRRQSVLCLGQGMPGALYLLPFSGSPRPSGRGQLAQVDVTLIDGPALQDAAFAAMDIGGSIKAVLAVLSAAEAGSAERARIEARLGDALIGYVVEGE